MNETKLEQVNRRINEINNMNMMEASKYLAEAQYLRQLSNLLQENEITRNNDNTHYVFVDGEFIRNDLVEEYRNLMSQVNLSENVLTNEEQVEVDNEPIELGETTPSMDTAEETPINTNNQPDFINKLNESRENIEKGSNAAIEELENTEIEAMKKSICEFLEQSNYDEDFKKNNIEAVMNENNLQTLKDMESWYEYHNPTKILDIENYKDEMYKIVDRCYSGEANEKYKEMIKNTNDKLKLEEMHKNLSDILEDENKAIKHKLDSYNFDDELRNYFDIRIENAKTVEDVDTIMQQALERYQSINNYNPEYTGPVNENEQLMVVDPQKESTDVEEKKVTGIRKATEFLKKHKKKIIIGLGLAALSSLFVPGVAPALMYANSVLWHSSPAIVQPILHGCNAVLANFAGAIETIGASGEILWEIGGTAINSTAATGSILSALGTAALGFTGTAAIYQTVVMTCKKLKNKFNKLKNKEISKDKEVKIEKTYEEKTDEKDKEKQSIK